MDKMEKMFKMDKIDKMDMDKRNKMDMDMDKVLNVATYIWRCVKRMTEKLKDKRIEKNPPV